VILYLIYLLRDDEKIVIIEFSQYVKRKITFLFNVHKRFLNVFIKTRF